jgi:hypothetical protein
MGVLLMIRGNCSHFRAKAAHFSGHLPAADKTMLRAWPLYVFVRMGYNRLY